MSAKTGVAPDGRDRSGGSEGEGGQHDLVAGTDPQRQQGQVQARGPGLRPRRVGPRPSPAQNSSSKAATSGP